ncbi:hypothetical protein [Citrobacter portucalensis]|uniref:hypothetical protein n=1 Tax=Citrobacter portucalensis TaxID=1639133 RepID=UPI001867D6FB|nr:hypothetical protein [Citrobacter freundii]EJD6668175.1 hypothetical protein [Citrobacter freundii]MBQ0205467.1 hypothetical protein [Citrobacter freundii]
MTALNKQALNPEELESALLKLKRISEQPAVSTHYARVLRKHIANLNCALGAAEKRIAELEARTVTLPYLPDDCDRTEAHFKYQAAITAAGIGVKGD